MPRTSRMLPITLSAAGCRKRSVILGVASSAKSPLSNCSPFQGWQYINIDEGWMLGRNATTLEPIPDPHAFPEGMNGLGDYIHSKVS